MEAKQIITVKQTKEKSKVILTLEERKNIYESNTILKTEAIIGMNGMTDNKKEGDGKTPRGTYKLGKTFGINENPGTHLAYIQIDKNYYWVDDSNSQYYNKMINIKNTKKDWKSAEHLIEYRKEYEYAIEIMYNEDGIRGKGSAIFLHCIGDKEYTGGCIAIKKEYLIKIIKGLKEGAIIKIE